MAKSRTLGKARLKTTFNNAPTALPARDKTLMRGQKCLKKGTPSRTRDHMHDHAPIGGNAMLDSTGAFRHYKAHQRSHDEPSGYGEAPPRPTQKKHGLDVHSATYDTEEESTALSYDSQRQQCV